MEVNPYIPIGISVLSLLISFYTFRQTYKLNLDTRDLNYRRALSEEFKEHSDLLHKEFWKIKDDLSELSSLLCLTNSEIGNIFDKYDERNRIHNKALRHLYVDLFREVAEKFRDELSWQTPENIYIRLSRLKNLDPSLDFVKKKNRRFLFKRKEILFWDTGLIRSESFAENFRELLRAISTTKHENLYLEFISTCKQLEEVMVKLQKKCLESYELIESGISRNSLQEFKLWEYSPLYTRYIRYKCLMKFISQSKLSDLSTQNDPPYLVVSNIIYYGANIQMINNLACDTIFSFDD